MEAFLAWLNGIIWSNALIALCLGAGLWFSFRTRFMQVRGFVEMCRLTVTGQKSEAGVSSFQALAISMAGRMGIGNIAGAVLGGILLGLIESLGAGYIGDLTGGFLGSNYQDIFAFFVLICVLVFRPSGLIGERVSERA